MARLNLPGRPGTGLKGEAVCDKLPEGHRAEAVTLPPTNSLQRFRHPLQAALLLGIVLLGGCAETMDSTYSDLEAARANGAIERGRIPDWIPATAVKLYEAHNQDSNESMLAAHYDEGQRIEWTVHCTQVGPFEPPQPPFRRKWWPSDVPASRWSTPRHVFLRCGEDSFAAFGEGEFYYWRRAGR